MRWTEKLKQEATEIIFARIREGESIRSILPPNTREENLPSQPTFFEWIGLDSDLAKQYARACEARADMIFEEILDIADDTGNDVTFDADGGKKVNNELVNRSRLRVDARKWILSKMNPKKFGDSTKVEHSTESGVTKIIIETAIETPPSSD